MFGKGLKKKKTSPHNRILYLSNLKAYVDESKNVPHMMSLGFDFVFGILSVWIKTLQEKDKITYS